MYKGIFIMMDHPICRCGKKVRAILMTSTGNSRLICLSCPSCHAEFKVPRGELHIQYASGVMPEEGAPEDPGTRLDLLMNDGEKT